MKKFLYDLTKWTALVALPAAAVLVTALTPIWDIPRGEEIALTITAVDVFLGTLVGVESARNTKRELGKYEIEKYEIGKYEIGRATNTKEID